jgi:hypothetical protein
MPNQVSLVKAQFQEITWLNNTDWETKGSPISVQFNPETLTVTYDRPDTLQESGKPPTSTLSVELWFDVTAAPPAVASVRDLTSKLSYFIQPAAGNLPWDQPGVRFAWGDFIFLGRMTSYSESLSYFAQDGTPLRAKVSVSLQSKLMYQPSN